MRNGLMIINAFDELVFDFLSFTFGDDGVVCETRFEMKLKNEREISQVFCFNRTTILYDLILNCFTDELYFYSLG